ncbi:hypothetical protein AGMMS49944_07620 [Spirochaetia bacterium]|nr:hypothetical protein AGMMS49944_07620 [Spirochaetia bacterium]
MCFDRILAVVDTLMPLIAVIAAGLTVPKFLDWWAYHKVRSCYHSLLSYFDKVCRDLGCKGPCELREEPFEAVSDVESFIQADKDRHKPIKNQYWGESHRYNVRSSLNYSRTKAGLDNRNFYLSRYFMNNQFGELLVILTVINNTAEIKAFSRGDWIFPKASNLKRRLRRIRVKFFGYKHDDYSIMLV